MLKGKRRDEALDALRELSGAFLRRRASRTTSASLSDGHAGMALVHVALEGLFPGEGHTEKAQAALSSAVSALATVPMGPGLYSGFTGVAWAVEHLVGDPSASSEDDMNGGIDAALEGHLTRRGKWKGPYDLIEGLVGTGIYALERLPRPSAARVLELVIERLAETAEPQKRGVAWRSRPEWVPAIWRPKPFFYWNLGLAHGVPGVIGMLGRAVAAKVATRDARRLLEKGVTWLMTQELPASAAGAFDQGIARGVAARPTRLAWCYGDAGIAASLMVAGRAAGEPSWERHALRIALRAAERAGGVAGAGVIDAGLCHGSAGLAHIFHRLYRATGEPRLAKASREWFGHTLSMRKPGRGVGGFMAYRTGKDGKLGWNAAPGFLEGAGGVALALAGSIDSKANLGWDRVLLVSDKE